MIDISIMLTGPICMTNLVKTSKDVDNIYLLRTAKIHQDNICYIEIK